MNIYHSKSGTIRDRRILGVQIAEYCQYEMGPTSTAQYLVVRKRIMRVLWHLRGIIHVEICRAVHRQIDVMPRAFRNISVRIIS